SGVACPIPSGGDLRRTFECGHHQVVPETPVITLRVEIPPDEAGQLEHGAVGPHDHLADGPGAKVLDQETANALHGRRDRGCPLVTQCDALHASDARDEGLRRSLKLCLLRCRHQRSQEEGIALQGGQGVEADLDTVHGEGCVHPGWIESPVIQLEPEGVHLQQVGPRLHELAGRDGGEVHRGCAERLDGGLLSGGEAAYACGYEDGDSESRGMSHELARGMWPLDVPELLLPAMVGCSLIPCWRQASTTKT